jgi:hypothetical protein
MDWLSKLLETVLGGLPSAAVALCPDDVKKQWLVRLNDHNPFKTIAANHDLVRATRLAWIEAAQEVLNEAKAVAGRHEWHGSADAILAFDTVIRKNLLDVRDHAFVRDEDAGPSPIDAHVEAVIAGVPELVSPGEHAGIGAEVTTGFTITLARLTDWKVREIPAIYQQIAEQGLPTQGGGPPRRFGELVFAAFAEIIKDPKRYPEAREAFYIAMDKVGRDIGKATFDAVKGLDGRLEDAIRRLDALEVFPDSAIRNLNFLPDISSGVVTANEKLDEVKRLLSRSATTLFPPSSKSLKGSLRPFYEVPDAWLRFTEGQLSGEVPFVGREAELARLLAFATGKEDQRPFTWQVLWGAHATGKSRLAREWLRVLGGSAPVWDGGFAADSGAELLNLLSLEPSAPTAIVIDEAASYGESLWLFLQRAERWRYADKPVRVLLVAHEDLMPPAGGGLERSESVRALRQVAPLDPARTALLFQAGRAKPTVQTMSGIRLDPLGEGEEQAALLNAVEKLTRRPLSRVERSRILRDADGRPALLVLAATAPDGWHHQLTNYAPIIAKDAEALFAPSRDGLKVLAASVLAGPFPDHLRRIIAPGATPPHRLLSLFPDSSNDLAREIPRFQPDILGFHVLGSTLGVLSSSERQDLARSLQDANRDRFVAQIDACFAALEPTYDYYFRLLAPDENRVSAAFAGMLDDLVSVMAEHPDHLINRPSSRACDKRRDAVISILKIADKISEDVILKVIEAALKYSPRNSLDDVLAAALVENGLSRADIARWLALIEDMTVPFGPVVRANVSMPKVESRDPRTDDGAASLTAAMRSTMALDRLEASYQLGSWLQKNPMDGRLVLQTRQHILADLAVMVESHSDSVRTAAAWCIKQVVQWEVPLEGSAEIDRIVDTATASLRRWVASPEPSHYVGQFIALHDFKLDCQIAEHARRWFDDIIDLQAVPCHRLGSDAIALLRRIATRNYDIARSGQEIVAFNEEMAANILMRAGQYEAGAAAAAERLLLLDRTTERKLSTLCRLAATGTAEAFALIKSVVSKMNDRDDVAILICAFALLSGKLEVVDVMRPIVERSKQPVDVDALLTIARKRKPGSLWRGAEVDALRKRIADFHVRRNGHLIHKLKAKDSTDSWAYYFVLVQPEKESAFMAAFDGVGRIDLEDYGSVIASCYGEKPDYETRRFLKDNYGFDV